MSELRGEFERVWGEPTDSNNRPYLIKRIAWRKQAAAHGGLSEAAREMARELARDADLRVRSPKSVHAAYARVESEDDSSSKEMPRAGSRLIRMYRGRRIEVDVLERGFVWDGREFASLTAVAHAVTGSIWNGRLFFGLTKRKAES
ncbi:MAG: DUF2924 domain-containing protein [Myxococcales bacterium]|nr:DUF2924 domain-containing protein [Myxococcales bacterium]